MKSPGPSTAERVIGYALSAICIAVVIALAAWQRSVMLMIFAAVVTVLIPFSLFRSRKLSEEEMLRRQDKAMGQPTDDPREMARWVP